MSALPKLSTPPEEIESAKNTTKLLPEVSKEKYMKTYDKFMTWRTAKNINSFTENALCAYFNDLSSTLKPSSLWPHYSMLKKTLMINQNINIETYHKLIALIKKQNDGFQSKKAKIFTSEDISNFLNNAPDTERLDQKVIIIFGINGACRREELWNVEISHVQEYKNSMILVTLPDTKTLKTRTFVITDKFYNIVKKYMDCRPKNCKYTKFFLNFHKGKCTKQPIGINKFGNMPKKIATYLNLPEPERYTGLSFRRTSTTFLADSGADITTIKEHGGWQSNKAAKRYIEESIKNKQRISEKIGQNITINTKECPSTFRSSTDTTIEEQSDQSEVYEENENLNMPPLKKAKPNSTECINTNQLLSQTNNNSTINESVNLSSNIKFPGENIILTLNNCSNVSFNFCKK